MKPKGKLRKKKRQDLVKRSGLFITFEGIEGCGKTTQCRRLAATLQTQGYRVVETREPGGTPFAEQIRELLLRSTKDPFIRDQPTPECEATLIFACRSQHINHVIAPALSQGAVVLCDRFSDSTLTYQGYGRGLSIEELQSFNEFVTNGLNPDLTFVFDLPVKLGLARRKKARNQNRMDRESLAFHERVHKGFLALARLDPERIAVLDGRKHPKVISSEVSAKTAKFLAAQGKLALKKAFPNHKKTHDLKVHHAV